MQPLAHGQTLMLEQSSTSTSALHDPTPSMWEGQAGSSRGWHSPARTCLAQHPEVELPPCRVGRDAWRSNAGSGSPRQTFL